MRSDFLFTFLSEKYLRMLQDNQIDTFEKVWDYQVNWFEEPNERRGGWSGVGCIVIKQDDGSMMRAFLKKQDNHCLTSILHPIKGVPTFQREFEMMRYLNQRGVQAPEVLLFGRDPAGSLKTTLMTRGLDGFISLEELVEQIFSNNTDFSKKRAVINTVAAFTKRLHAEAKVQHRSFYPKHLFVNMANVELPEVAVIDLEKSRVNWIPALRSLIDLSTLNRHSKYWSKTRRMSFYLQYLGLKKLTPYAKWLCRLIIKRSSRVKAK
jgi:hypothetical protein